MKITTANKSDVGEVEEKIEDKKEHWNDRWGRRLGLAFLMFFGILILGSLMIEMKPKGEGWLLFFAFASIPAAFTGLVEWMWRTFFDGFKSDVDFRRLVYGLVIITYLGCWAVYLVDKSSARPSRPIKIEVPSKLDVNLSTPSYAPIRIDTHHTQNGVHKY